MGIIHKITQEVRDFIVRQKEEQNSLSCRQLAEVTSEKFQIVLSKSSVNFILKKAMLSSVVGRRSKVRKVTPKFQIPLAKKQVLREGLAKLKDNKVEAKSEIKIVKKKEKLSRRLSGNMILENSDVENKELTTSELDEKLVLGQPPPPIDILKISALKVEKEKSPSLKKESDDFRLLKEAARDVNPQGIGLFLGDLVRKNVLNIPDFLARDSAKRYMKENERIIGVAQKHRNTSRQNKKSILTSKEYFNDLCELCIFSEVLQQEILDKDIKNMKDWAKTVKVSDSFLADYMVQQEQNFAMIGGFRITLEGRERFFLDGEMTAIKSAAMFKDEASSLNKAVELLSACLMNNNQCLISHLDEAAPLLNVIAAFEQWPGKKIEKIAIISEEGAVMAEFSMIPEKARTFMIGISKGFEYLIKTVHWVGKKRFQHERLGQDIYYTETKSDFTKKIFSEAKGLRVISLWSKSSDRTPSLVILTNQFKGDTQEIILEYLTHCPRAPFRYCEESLKFFRTMRKSYIDKGMTEWKQELNLWDLFVGFGCRLHKYLITHDNGFTYKG